jgi:hypothetical protein
LLTGIERNLIKVQDDVIGMVKLFLAGKSVEEISATLDIPIQNVIEIKEKFESE